MDLPYDLYCLFSTATDISSLLAGLSCSALGLNPLLHTPIFRKYPLIQELQASRSAQFSYSVQVK